MPHVETSSTGEKVTVLRLPRDATQLERLESHQEVRRLAGGAVVRLKAEFWRTRARDARRLRALREETVV